MRVLLLALALAVAAPASAQLSVDVAFPSLTFSSPVGIEHDGDAERLYVVEQGGVIRVFDNDPDATSADAFLDITDRVDDGPSEAGLLGLAFHPDYADNGYVFVSYTIDGSPLTSRVSRFTRSTADPMTADPTTELVLLEIDQPFGNHNGGGLVFGPDGYLYASFGDGGSGGDPEENGEDPTTLLGSILRLDVDGGGDAPDCGGEGANYTVPPNAIADGPGGACDEIYAWGLRNPWRFSFDRETGQGWIADVGQNQWEEIDRMEDGGNYGWNTYEGNVCFDGPCDPEGLVFPEWVYSSQTGSPHCSVTGGYVYRGSDAPELAGKYVYGDFCSGRLWAFDPVSLADPNEQLPVGTFGGLTSFGEDADGELYLVRTNGRVYRFFSDSNTSTDDGVPQTAARLSVYPSPASHAVSVEVSAAAAGPVRVAVYDVLGREVAVLHDGPAPAADEPLTFDAADLPAGLYVVRMESAQATLTRNVVVAH
jgi:glucose/arabinose dehydrogenase